MTRAKQRAHLLAGEPRRNAGNAHHEAGSARPEAGSAIVEFIAVAVIFLVPLVYLIVAAAQLQGATFAAHQAARDAARSAAHARIEADTTRATRNVELSFAAYGIDVDGAAALSVHCEADPCHTPGAGITTTVRVDVPLPLMPDLAGLPTAVPVSAEHRVVVSHLRGQP